MENQTHDTQDMEKTQHKTWYKDVNQIQETKKKTDTRTNKNRSHDKSAPIRPTDDESSVLHVRSEGPQFKNIYHQT